MKRHRLAQAAMLAALLLPHICPAAKELRRRTELPYCALSIRVLNTQELTRHGVGRMDTIVTATLRQMLEQERSGWRSLDGSVRNRLSARVRSELASDSITDSLPQSAVAELRNDSLTRVGLFYNYRTSYGSSCAERGRERENSYKMQFGLLDVARNRFVFVVDAHTRDDDHEAGLCGLLKELVRKAERELGRID
jgi:hypothetical protein